MPRTLVAPAVKTWLPGRLSWIDWPVGDWKRVHIAVAVVSDSCRRRGAVEGERRAAGLASAEDVLPLVVGVGQREHFYPARLGNLVGDGLEIAGIERTVVGLIGQRKRRNSTASTTEPSVESVTCKSPCVRLVVWVKESSCWMLIEQLDVSAPLQPDQYQFDVTRRPLRKAPWLNCS